MDRVNLPSTIWSVIHAAGRRGPDAIDLIVRKYRPAVVAFVRQQAPALAEDAEDVAQEVFLALVRDDVLAKADQARGRFRSFLLAVTRHAISTWRKRDDARKRGGDVRRISLSAAGGDGAPPLEQLLASPQADEGFDTLWIQNLVRLGMTRLREECEKKDSPQFRALSMWSGGEQAYAGIAESLGASVTDVKNWLHQGRKRLRELLLEEIESYSSSPDELRAEVEYLMRFLK